MLNDALSLSLICAILGAHEPLQVVKSTKEPSACPGRKRGRDNPKQSPRWLAYYPIPAIHCPRLIESVRPDFASPKSVIGILVVASTFYQVLYATALSEQQRA